MTHNKLPWKVCEKVFSYRHKVRSKNDIALFSAQTDNAKFIVRAVNSHDELVRAIEYVFASGQPLLTRTAIEKLQSALKLAKGE